MVPGSGIFTHPLPGFRRAILAPASRDVCRTAAAGAARWPRARYRQWGRRCGSSGSMPLPAAAVARPRLRWVPAAGDAGRGTNAQRRSFNILIVGARQSRGQPTPPPVFLRGDFRATQGAGGFAVRRRGGSERVAARARPGGLMTGRLHARSGRTGRLPSRFGRFGVRRLDSAFVGVSFGVSRGGRWRREETMARLKG